MKPPRRCTRGGRASPRCGVSPSLAKSTSLRAAAEDRLIDIVNMTDRQIRPALPGWGLNDGLDAQMYLRWKLAETGRELLERLERLG